MSEQLQSWLLILGGLIALVGGGELLVRGAAAIAEAFRIPSLVIGLTVVAFGTSAPELGVSLQAAFTGAADVAVGNVVGSNILNVLFVLGVSTLIAPLVVSRRLIRFDLLVMIAVSLLTWGLASDGLVSRVDGTILFFILILYIGTTLAMARRESVALRNASSTEELPEQNSRFHLAAQIGYVLAGLALLGVGSKWLVSGAVFVATWLGVSELLIGLTVVAAGTSMPELVTSLMASVRGQRDIAVGNVVGSNLFNLAFVLGLSSAIAPSGMAVSAQALRYDLPIMCLIAVICLPVFATGKQISRWEGALFATGFVVYTCFRIYS
ncbi:calcium/sodium antiporter [Planctomycetes bacterium K23_9]|uniref:Inner membrane protein YrbG n=1 Tax=Stieleria marina TaxID=1930275 RepID=A0A517NVG8_9BACT|nr:Inner membrane protein YrbG [Planctomycetes bacterium K23_9]